MATSSADLFEQALEEDEAPATGYKWLLLCAVLLGFHQAEMCELWGMSEFLDIAMRLRAARASCLDSSGKHGVQGAAKACNLIRGCVRSQWYRPGDPGIDRCKALRSMCFEIAICYCVRESGVASFSFLNTLDDAFGGELYLSRDLSSQLLQAYHKMRGEADGTLPSKDKGWTARWRKQKQEAAVGWTLLCDEWNVCYMRPVYVAKQPSSSRFSL